MSSRRGTDVKKKTAKKKSTRKSGPKSGLIMMAQQPHGGAIRVGSLPGNTPGTGRPPDVVRAKLRELGAKKSVPFLSGLLDGKVSVSLLGKCDACGHDQPISEDIVGDIMDRVGASVDQRLKATEQTFKHGLQAKELVIASDTAAAFFDCVHTAIVEIAGEQVAEQAKMRALQLMEAKA